ncbi:MAG TPA: hypothetical protein IGS53_11090 [Leptolyngbyaceae cyanobacterium M33_DOE_097]|uniref:Uncharacterized protein n=1 Tax=Oscillatoriales cyanobacterium SpSt-418 TaxID=2282169 RepID=A0A7C3KEG1_9CYAN|nr:hypothetical protein [Leptolyngbyaceae cyanobacterium M33_DOE_097]
MIRTKLVELSTLAAVAYRQKLKDGPGVVILRYDTTQPGFASISRKTGEPVPSPNTNLEIYPLEAFQEAIELTGGMPYSRRGKVQLSGEAPAETTGDIEEFLAEDFAVVDSAEYRAIVDAYTNKKGDLSYDLLNKDFIQFAKSSKIVSDMVNNQVSLDDLRDYIIKVKFETLTGSPNLTPSQMNSIVEVLDEVSPRYLFRELNDELKKMLSQAKAKF